MSSVFWLQVSLIKQHTALKETLLSIDYHKHRVAQRKLYGVEGSSTFLECIPKSLQARVSWTYKKLADSPTEEVSRAKVDVVCHLTFFQEADLMQRWCLFINITQ